MNKHLNINPRTLKKREEDLKDNQLGSTLLSQELPSANTISPESEVVVYTREDRADGVFIKPVRVPVSAISSTSTGGKALLGGGAMWSGTGYIYYIDIYYTFGYGNLSTIDEVELEPADPEFDRFDAIVVNENSEVYAKQGVASATPLTPSIAEDEILIQYVLVEGGTTEPTVGIENVYLDNEEWTTTRYGDGILPAMNLDLNSTYEPFQGTKNIRAINLPKKFGVRFQRVGSINLDDYAILSFYIILPEPMGLLSRVLISVWNDGESVGSVVNANDVGGINRNLINEWQLVIINASAFGASEIDRMQIRVDSSAFIAQSSFRIDYIRWMTGIAPPVFNPAISFFEDGVLKGTRSRVDFSGATLTDDPVNDKMNVVINAIEDVDAGTGISIDKTIPKEPVISLNAGLYQLNDVPPYLNDGNAWVLTEMNGTLFWSSGGGTASFGLALSDTESDLEVIENVETFHFPFDFKLEKVVIEVGEAPEGAAVIVDAIQTGVGSIFLVPANIQPNEKTSLTSTVTLATTVFLAGDELTFNITQVGTVTAGQRLKIHLIGSMQGDIPETTNVGVKALKITSL